MKVTLNRLKQYVAFNSSPSGIVRRLTMLGHVVKSCFAATEGRKIVAHGVSRGLGVLRFNSPGGATEYPLSFTRFLSPLTGLLQLSYFSHGCHPGQFSVAVPRLNLN